MKTDGPIGERMARLEEKTDNIEKMLIDLSKKFDDFVECAPKKFSAKWVEKGVAWAIFLIVGAVLTAIITLVVPSTN